jgi:HPt (histidine-containing phosphotransfer) domain-containing protein
MVTSYFELAPGLMDDLRTAVGKGDSAAVTSIAHTLKGGCGNFFAKAAFEAALLLENMGKQGDVSGAEDGLRKLQQELDRLKEALKNSVQT